MSPVAGIGASGQVTFMCMAEGVLMSIQVFMSAPFEGVVGGTSILQRLRADTFFHHVAAHSRGPSRAGFPVASAFGLGRWACVHGAKNFAPSTT